MANEIVSTPEGEEIRYYLEDEDQICTSGVSLVRKGNSWVVSRFEEDSFYNGRAIEDIESSPYIVEKFMLKKQRDLSSNLCILYAKSYGITREEAENCERNFPNCPGCPFKEGESGKLVTERNTKG